MTPMLIMLFGFVVGLTSVGSGTFFGLAMLVFFPTLAAHRIVGTDLLHAAMLLWVAGAGHLLHGNVEIAAGIGLVAFAVWCARLLRHRRVPAQDAA